MYKKLSLPLNHKTVFVFDHGPAMAACSNYEIKTHDLLKSRQNEKQKAFSIAVSFLVNFFNSTHVIKTFL